MPGALAVRCAIYGKSSFQTLFTVEIVQDTEGLFVHAVIGDEPLAVEEIPDAVDVIPLSVQRPGTSRSKKERSQWSIHSRKGRPSRNWMGSHT